MLCGVGQIKTREFTATTGSELVREITYKLLEKLCGSGPGRLAAIFFTGLLTAACRARCAKSQTDSCSAEYSADFTHSRKTAAEELGSGRRSWVLAKDEQ